MTVESGEHTASFAVRLKQIVRDQRNASQFAHAIGRSEGALRNWLTRRSQPVVSDILRICAVSGTRVEWLMIGRGPRKEAESSQVSEPSTPYAKPQPPDEELLQAVIEAIERELQRAHVGELAPEKKAALTIHCYDLMGSMAAFDPKKVARLVKLAM